MCLCVCVCVCVVYLVLAFVDGPLLWPLSKTGILWLRGPCPEAVPETHPPTHQGYSYRIYSVLMYTAPNILLLAVYHHSCVDVVHPALTRTERQGCSARVSQGPFASQRKSLTPLARLIGGLWTAKGPKVSFFRHGSHDSERGGDRTLRILAGRPAPLARARRGHVVRHMLRVSGRG